MLNVPLQMYIQWHLTIGKTYFEIVNTVNSK